MATAATSVLSSLLGSLGGLLKAHEKRLQNATSENAHDAALIQAFDEAVKQIFADANSGAISADDAIADCGELQSWYWQQIQTFAQQHPGGGIAGTSCVGNFTPDPPNADNYDGTICDKMCTSGCCIGCNDIDSAIANMIYVFRYGGGTAKIPTVNPSPAKYKFAGRAGYTVTYSPNAITKTTGTINSFVNNLLGGSSTGTGSFSTLIIVGVLGVLALFFVAESRK